MRPAGSVLQRLAFWALTLAAVPAAADPETANRLDREAQALASKRDFVGAAQKFREAFAADPRPEIMCNVGVAYFKASDWPRSHRYLTQCLSLGGGLDAGFVGNVRKVLDSIGQKLQAGAFTPVDIAVSPATSSTTIEQSPFDEPIVGSGRVYLPHGSYRVVVHAEGHVDHVATLAATGRAAIELGVALPVAKPQEPPVRPPPPPPPVEEPVPTPPAPPRPSRAPAIAVTAGTVVLGAAALAVYGAARAAVTDAEEAVEYADFDEHRRTAKRRQQLAWALGGAAGATAIVSGYLWYRATRSTTTATVELAPGPSGAAAATLSFGGRF